MRLVLTATSVLGLAIASAGCTSAPSPIDMTPRFVQGQERTESLMTYAAVRTAVADVVAHVGFSWSATVKSVGPEGATIAAHVDRVVVKLPGLLTFDTRGSLPMRLLGVSDLLFNMLNIDFEYLVNPAGRVKVSGWQASLEAAAGKAGCELPQDGSVPNEGMIAETLTRVYSSPPRRAVSVDDTWTTASRFHVGTPERGSDASTTSKYVYEGFGELEAPFGGDEVKVEGLGLPFEGTPSVSARGDFYLGAVGTQTGKTSGFLCVAPSGDQVLGYWEKNELEIEPREGLLPVGGSLVGAVVSVLADLEHGWVFFANPR